MIKEGVFILKGGGGSRGLDKGLRQRQREGVGHMTFIGGTSCARNRGGGGGGGRWNAHACCQQYLPSVALRSLRVHCAPVWVVPWHWRVQASCDDGDGVS